MQTSVYHLASVADAGQMINRCLSVISSLHKYQRGSAMCARNHVYGDSHQRAAAAEPACRESDEMGDWLISGQLVDVCSLLQPPSPPEKCRHV